MTNEVKNLVEPLTLEQLRGMDGQPVWVEFDFELEADRDGRCVVLPCKVGDTVYWAVRGRVRKAGFDLSASKYFGKYVFTTREAAEQALKEGEKDG